MVAFLQLLVWMQNSPETDVSTVYGVLFVNNMYLSIHVRLSTLHTTFSCQSHIIHNTCSVELSNSVTARHNVEMRLINEAVGINALTAGKAVLFAVSHTAQTGKETDSWNTHKTKPE